MYKVNDVIFYSSTGVCRVKAVGKPDIKGMPDGVDYYTLQPISETHREMIYVPVATKAFMRSTMSSRQAYEYIDYVKSLSPVYPSSRNPKAIADFYTDLIGSYKSENLLQVIVSLTVKKRENQAAGKQLNQTQSGFLRQAQEMILGEFSLVLDMPKDKVWQMIDENISKRAD